MISPTTEPNIGRALRRKEDVRFLTGRGNYVDDQLPTGTSVIAFVRSPHAHAKIASVSTDSARVMPGVLLVLTAQDWKAAGLGELTCVHPMPFSDGRPMNERLRPAFAADRVCHVGDIVAAVVAEDRYLALDAADAVEVDYEILPAVTETAHALDPGAPVIHPDLGTNLVNEVIRGDKAATEAAFRSAAHVTELTLVSNRVAGNPLEPRSYLAEYNPGSDMTTLWATTQVPHMLRSWLSKFTLHIPEHRLRVIAPDVGGGFGPKVNFTVEVSTVVWAARLLGRPVKWTATRSELMLSDVQARDHVTRARMAFDAQGKVLGLEVDTIANFGGYLSNFGPSIPGISYPQTITGLYTTPNLSLRVRGVYTNSLPVDAYRGSGRPEATFVNERLFENGARELGIDVVEMRRRNLIQAHQFPYKTPVGRTYDCGNPPEMLRKLVALANYDALREEQKRLRAQGVLMGIGLAAFLDKSGTGSSRALASKGGLHGGYECSIVRVHSDGKATVFVGSHCHGQGHETAFAQIAADRLGIPMDDIQIVEGDTDRIPFGIGTWGSRSASVGGTAILKASDKIIDKATRIAAQVLECPVADVEYRDSMFSIAGTDRRISFPEIAGIAYHGAVYPPEPDFEPGLEATVFYDPPDTNDPLTLHLAVVIVDRPTGRVTIRNYFAVDDCGNIINPMIVEGQIQGGLAQGIGQAQMEHVVYDRENGQMLSGTFMDYAMPRAVDMPPLEIDYVVTPAPSNPLGVKGGSESGTIGPPGTLGNAVVDALWHLGVRHVELPLTPYSVWRALRAAERANAANKSATGAVQ